MRLLIDGNRYTDFARGVQDVVARFESAAVVYLSLIVLGELRGGFAVGSQKAANEKVLDEFLGRSNVEVLALDEATADQYAVVYCALRQLGKPIPMNDMWIAAQALQHDLTLDTRDRHFQYVPRLKLA